MQGLTEGCGSTPSASERASCKWQRGRDTGTICLASRLRLYPCLLLLCIIISRPVLGNAYRPLGPWYVTGKDIANNVLHISNRILAEGTGAGLSCCPDVGLGMNSSQRSACKCRGGGTRQVQLHRGGLLLDQRQCS